MKDKQRKLETPRQPTRILHSALLMKTNKIGSGWAVKRVHILRQQMLTTTNIGLKPTMKCHSMSGYKPPISAELPRRRSSNCREEPGVQVASKVRLDIFHLGKDTQCLLLTLSNAIEHT